MNKIKFPFRIDHDGKGGFVVGPGNAGWTMGEFDSAAEVKAFMERHPEAAMPCWKRFAGDAVVMGVR